MSNPAQKFFDRLEKAMDEKLWVRLTMIAAAVVIGLIVLAVALGEGSAPPAASTSASTAAEPDAPESEEPASRFRGTKAEIESAFVDALGDDAPGDRPRVEEINRVGTGEYFIIYNPDELAFGEDEVLRDLRPVFDELLNGQSLELAEVMPYTKLVTPGGKEKWGPLLSVGCDQDDNAEIDWEVVDEDGMKELCDYRLFVSK